MGPAKRRGIAFQLSCCAAAVGCAAALAAALCAPVAPVAPVAAGLAAASAVEGAASAHPWPEVDWAAWQSANPDVVGWLTIPGAGIDQPIVAARAADPSFYLAHDAYGSPSPYGAVMLDAGCDGDLMGCQNAVLLGHHMDDGTMMAPVASYGDASWASEHPVAYVQAPGEVRAFTVRFAERIRGSEPAKRTSFASQEDFEGWWSSRLEGACMALDGTPPRVMRPAPLPEGAAGPVPDAEQALTLCTCSYTFAPADERTLAYFSAEVG